MKSKGFGRNCQTVDQKVTGTAVNLFCAEGGMFWDHIGITDIIGIIGIDIVIDIIDIIIVIDIFDIDIVIDIVIDIIFST